MSKIERLNQGGGWYVRVDLTIKSKINVLLGFNYLEGSASICPKTGTFEDCLHWEYGEFQIGFLFFTIAIGRDTPKKLEDLLPITFLRSGNRDKDNSDVPDGTSESTAPVSTHEEREG